MIVERKIQTTQHRQILTNKQQAKYLEYLRRREISKELLSDVAKYMVLWTPSAFYKFSLFEKKIHPASINKQISKDAVVLRAFF